MAELLASIEDVNAYLTDQVIVADDVNTALLQISTARIVRGYLSRVIDNGILALWASPDDTPEIVREIAGMLIASQLFFDKTILSTVEVDQRHYAQILYDRAMKMLNDIISGLITLPEVIVDSIEGMSTADFFPVDATDRAFTMNQEF